MEQNDINEIVRAIVTVLPEDWEKVWLYSQITESSYEFFFYVKVENECIQCYDLEKSYGITRTELRTCFRKLKDIIKPIYLKEKFYVMTSIIDRRGKYTADFEYKDFSENSLQYKKIWEDKYIKNTNFEYKKIKEIIDSILFENNLEGKVTINYGFIRHIPEEISILRKSLGWYYYISDDRNNGYFKGPYDLNALLQLIAWQLPIAKIIKESISSRYYSVKLEKRDYIDNELFKTEEEIDLYEAEHPEKKVE